MRYAIELGSKARQQLSEMDRDVKRIVIDKLLDLRDPDMADEMLRPSVSPPYPPGYLVYEFVITDPREEKLWNWIVAILALKSDCGTKLDIYSIPHRDGFI
jgi:hypothetical protein